MIKKNIPFRLFFLTAFLISAGLFNYAHAGSATLSWNANTESDLAGYRIYYGTSARTGACPTGGYPNNINVGNVAAYTFSNLTDGSTYYFSITAYDTSGNESCFSSQVSKLIPASSDVSAPTVPTGLTASAVSSSQISLSWAASTDNTGVTGYKIYRGGVQIATSATNNYVDTGLSPSTAYSYAVSAYDAAGNNSSQSSSVSATTLAASLPAPGTVSNLSASAANSTSVTLSFTQVNDGNGQPAKYDVRYATPTISWGSAQSVTNGTCSTPLVGTQIGTTMVCAVNGLTPSTQYQFQLVSYRGTLNAGAVFGGLSNVVSATTPSGSTPDASAPTTPAGLTATAVSSSQINLSWAASTDNVGVAGYRIYRGGNQIATSATTNYSNTGLSPSTAYSYTVSAYDAAGNNSSQSSSVSATTLAAADTTGPTISSVAASSVTSSGATITWTTNENSDSQVEYGLTSSYGSNTTLSASMVTSHSQSLSGLSAGTLYHYRARSKDASGNLSYSGDYTFTTGSAPDTSPPTNPNNLTATAVSSSQINLSWAASTDNVGVAGYRIYRGGNQIATSATTNYSNTGLSPSTAYSYTVSAYDAAGNNSSQSSSVSATTLAAAQSLSLAVSFQANPDSGKAPLKVTLKAKVSGTASGNINYTFYCNRSDSGTNITTPYDAKYNNTSQTSRTAVCAYQNSGVYTAKIIVERGEVQAENRTVITVKPQALTPYQWLEEMFRNLF